MLTAWVLGLCAMGIGGTQDGPVLGDRLVALARAAIASEVREGTLPKPAETTAPKPVFVTIEVNGAIRGCRGSLETTSGSLEAEVMRAAQMACRNDPRHRPVQQRELRAMLVTVTVVDRLEPIGAVDGLSPNDGLVLRNGDKVGVVLPWEGKDPKVRLGWAYRKAGVPQGVAAKLYRLVGERYRG